MQPIKLNCGVFAIALMFASDGVQAQDHVTGKVLPPEGSTITSVNSASVRVRFKKHPERKWPADDFNRVSGTFTLPTLSQGTYEVVANYNSESILPGCRELQMPLPHGSERESFDIRLIEPVRVPLKIAVYDEKRRLSPNTRIRVVPKCYDWDDQTDRFLYTSNSKGYVDGTFLLDEDQQYFLLPPATGGFLGAVKATRSARQFQHLAGPSWDDGDLEIGDDPAPKTSQNKPTSSPTPVVGGTLGKRPGVPLIAPADDLTPKAWQVNFTNGTVRPITELSVREKLDLHLRLFADPSSVFLPGVVAAVNQARNDPREWGQGAGGFGLRFASSYGYNTVVRNSLNFALGAVLHEDPRYFPSSERNVWSRIGDALLQTIVTHTDSGARTFSFWRVGGAFGTGFISNAWYPGRVSTSGDALLRGTTSLGLDSVVNVFREFAPDIVRGPCGHAGTEFDYLKECVTTIFTNDELRPFAASLAPGTDLALGLAGTPYRHFSEHASAELTMKAAVSLDRSYFAETALHFRLFRPERIRVRFGKAQEHNTPLSSLPEPGQFSFYARRFDLSSQDFYGLGPGTTQSGKAEYRERLDSFGGKAQLPIGFCFSGNLTIELLRPYISPDIDRGIPSVEQAYSELTAPGITSQPLFMHYVPSLGLRLSEFGPLYPEIKADYEIFQDIQSGHYSFRRLRLQANEQLGLGPDISRRRKHGRPSFESSDCDTCAFGELLIGARVSLSDKNASQAIPFYFQETLGGTNFQGADTLRGLIDYRFRGPHTLLMQMELRRRIWGPLGLSGFYDVGKVALLRSDIDFSHLRHDIGPGLYLTFSNKVILRAYIGFGAGEGSHPNFKLPSVL